MSIYVTDISTFAQVNEVYGSYFAADPPARTTIGVAALPGRRADRDGRDRRAAGLTRPMTATPRSAPSSPPTSSGRAPRSRDIARRTPVLPSLTLSERTGTEVVLKAENLQRTGSFKIRGALNKLAALGDGCARAA